METRNFQLQGSYTRYEDGYHAGYDSVEGPSKRRNFATIESAIRAAKKELKRNECTAVVRSEREYYGPNKRRDYNFNMYAADGHLIPWEEPHAFWHTNGVRIVDRETQEVLWES